MKPLHIGPAVLLVAVIAHLPVRAERTLPEPNWTHSEVRLAVAQADLLESLRPLLELARSREDAKLLQELNRLATDDSLPLPARERALFEFAVSLSDLDRSAVSPSALGFLESYQPRVLVPHEDSRQLGVPMYNIRAAAAGVANEWQWQAGNAEATALAEAPGEAWLAAYLSAEAGRRSGYLAQLEALSEPSLRSLAEIAAKRLTGQPDLTPVVSQAAVLLSDVELLQSALTRGSGPGLALTLRKAVSKLDESERAEVLNHAILNAPSANAALAMAEIAPGLLQQPEIRVLLFELLDDADLGAAAALALSRNPTADVQAQLEALAAQDLGLASRRAAIAATMARHAAGEVER